LFIHSLGALTWFAFLGFSSDIGTDRQFNEALLIGAATWLIAVFFMFWLWRSGKSALFWFIPFAWWLPSFLFAIEVVY